MLYQHYVNSVNFLIGMVYLFVSFTKLDAPYFLLLLVNKRKILYNR